MSLVTFFLLENNFTSDKSSKIKNNKINLKPRCNCLKKCTSVLLEGKENKFERT